MSDDLQSSEESSRVEDSVQTPKKRGRRWIAVLIVLLLLVGAGVAIYFYRPWNVLLDRFQAIEPSSESTIEDTLSRKVQDLETELQALREELRTENTRIENEFANQLIALENLVANQEGERQAIDVSATPLPYSRAWTTFFAGTLLQKANLELTTLRNPTSALAYLEAADEILRRSEGGNFSDVRVVLTQEIESLKQLVLVSVPSTYQRIEKLRQDMSEFPLDLFKYIDRERELGESVTDSQHSESQQSNADQSFLDKVFTFRKYDEEAIRPLLNPQQLIPIRNQLELSLSTAQLGLLRNDADIYQLSLRNIQHLLDVYIDRTQPVVENFGSEIESLQMLQIDPELPDISLSLKTLRDLTSTRNSVMREDVETGNVRVQQ